jgi:hypothetical protein
VPVGKLGMWLGGSMQSSWLIWNHFQLACVACAPCETRNWTSVRV